MATIMPADQIQEYIGKTGGPSDWLTVDQDRINAFADATLDHQFIHIDEAKAAQTPFGGTIAHGFLTLSLIPHLTADAGFGIEGTVMAINYGLNKLRFLQPVRAGKRVRAHTKLIEAQAKGGGRHLLTTEITIEIEGEDKPALIAEMLAMLVVQ